MQRNRCAGRLRREDRQCALVQRVCGLGAGGVGVFLLQFVQRSGAVIGEGHMAQPLVGGRQQHITERAGIEVVRYRQPGRAVLVFARGHAFDVDEQIVQASAAGQARFQRGLLHAALLRQYCLGIFKAQVFQHFLRADTGQLLKLTLQVHGADVHVCGHVFQLGLFLGVIVEIFDGSGDAGKGQVGGHGSSPGRNSVHDGRCWLQGRRPDSCALCLSQRVGQVRLKLASMDMQILLIVLLVVTSVAVVLLLVLLMSLRRRESAVGELRDVLETRLQQELRDGRSEQREALESVAARLAQEVQANRRETGERQQHLETALARQLQALSMQTETRLHAFGQALAEDAERSRQTGVQGQQQLAERLGQNQAQVNAQIIEHLRDLRTQVEKQLQAIQSDTATGLEKMRATVDEKLQSTLETRLGESFRLVSERLEAVQRGLGEMQQLASGVGDLKRVLGNVKTRGTLGEVQLGALLEEVLAPEQYARNIVTAAHGNERVEYAIRLPGGQGDAPIWLPIDAKFPLEDYNRLLDAQAQADAQLAQQAGQALERRLVEEARKIREKYIAPPATTDFALLFLPAEGLYAEALRRPGLFERLQRECRVTLVGPTTLLAVLNALQMGFRTLAIEKRSSEVWQTLGAVKTEFGKFGQTLEGVRKKLAEASNKMDDVGRRSRAIERQLRGVEALEAADAGQLPTFQED